MTRAASSIKYFGWYLLLEGLILFFLPNQLLGVLSLAPVPEPWLRILGMALGVIGYYYLRAAQANFTPFFHWTIAIRIVQFVAIIALVLFNLAPAILLLFSVIEAASAGWTKWALRSN